MRLPNREELPKRSRDGAQIDDLLTDSVAVDDQRKLHIARGLVR